MTELFYCPTLDQPQATLSESEAHHAIHVLRLKQDAPIELFDGAGKTAMAVISRINRSTVHVAVTSVCAVERPSTGTLTIAAAPPKGDRLKWMVEKLTELGVDRYVPLNTSRAVVDPRKSKLDKLKTTVISAAKQSRRRWLMEVCEPVRFSDLLAQQHDRQQFYLGHPYEAKLPAENVPDIAAGSDHVVLIGPEGGFTESEAELARASGAQQIYWPNSILRIETAAIAFAVMIRQRISAT